MRNKCEQFGTLDLLKNLFEGRVKEQNLIRRYSVTLEVCCLNKERRLSCLVAHSVVFELECKYMSHPIVTPHSLAIPVHIIFTFPSIP